MKAVQFALLLLLFTAVVSFANAVDNDVPYIATKPEAKCVIKDGVIQTDVLTFTTLKTVFENFW